MVGNGACVVDSLWQYVIGLGLTLVGLGLLAVVASHPNAMLVAQDFEREVSTALGNSWLGKKWKRRVAERQKKRIRNAIAQLAHYEIRIDTTAGPLLCARVDEFFLAVRYGGDNYREVFFPGGAWQFSVRNTNRFPDASVPNRPLNYYDATIIKPMKGDF